MSMPLTKNFASRILLAIVYALSFGTSFLNAHADSQEELKPNYKKVYLLYNVAVANEEQQPTWLAFRFRHKTIHISNNQSIAELRPGEYILSHIDFRESMHSGEDTQHFRANSRLFLEAGKVYYLGKITLSRVRRDEYDVSYSFDEDIIRAACKAAPSVFEYLPVSTFGRIPDRMISCIEP